MTDVDLPLHLSRATVPEIDRAIGSELFSQTFSGAACIASVGGRIFHNGVYGFARQSEPGQRTKGHAKIDHGTLFDLASLTKPLGTSLAAMWLSVRNRLDLGAPIAKTLPLFRRSPWEDVQVDMLLDHTSGLPAFLPFWEEIADLDAKVKPSEAMMGSDRATRWMQERIANLRLQHDPGTSVIYSDIGFILLAWIIESLVGRSLDDWLLREVYRPLGIHEELFFVRHNDVQQQKRLVKKRFVATEDCDWRGKLVLGEVHDRNAWALGGVAGHAGLFGTAEAVWRLCFYLWASFKGESRFFLPGGTRRFWRKSQRVRYNTYALGWDTPTVNNSTAGKRYSRNAIGHLGFTGTSIWIDLNYDIIGVVLTNAVHPNAEGKKELMHAFRAKIYDHIAKAGQSLEPEPEKGHDAWRRR